MRNSWIMVIVVSTVAIIWLAGAFFRKRQLDAVKPYITYTRLSYLASGCVEYKKEFGDWPHSLADIRAFRGDLNEGSRDMWGHDVVFIPYDKLLGYGRIISYGQDGKPGGLYEADQDIEVRFPTEDNAPWNDKVRLRLKQPRFRP